MADLSGYTPIYIRADGDNDTGDGSLGSPYATAQKGFDVAVATPSGNYVLDFGVGSFGGVVLTQNWPSRISVRGAGAAVSSIGPISGNGENAVYDWETGTFVASAQVGRQISIVSDLTLALVGVTSNGGDNGTSVYGEMGANGGSISLADCYIAGSVTANGGSSYGFNDSGAGSGGSVGLVGCVCDDVSPLSVTANGNSSNSSWHGGGGSVSMTDVTANLVQVKANAGASEGYYGYADYMKPAGTITLLRSRVDTVQAVGGASGPDIFASGGGTASLTDSYANFVSVAGGMRNNTYFGFPIFGQPGSITLAGSTPIPETLTGNVSTSNLNKGRGVNGSGILGIA